MNKTKSWCVRGFIALNAVISINLSAWALEPEVSQLVKYETKSNAVALRSDKAVAIEHFEIPLRLLEKDLARNLRPSVRKQLIFTQDGEEYLRWMINPEDTKWFKEVEEFLSKNGIEPVRYKYFTGYMTASRSYILESPDGVQFSAKVSTNKTGGNWTDKKQTWDDAAQVRMVSDFVADQVKAEPLRNVIIMTEPAAFGIKAIDQGMLIRDLADLPKDEVYYLPGFSAVHDATGTEIAKKNGAENVEEFWNEHYNKPLARALAEFAARTGLTYDSPHSQNFLVELDFDYKPTGKIVLRDFGDTYAMREWFVARGKQDFLNRWEKDNILDGGLHAAVGVLHGNELPSWMTESKYSQWGVEFYKEFDRELARELKAPIQSLAGKAFQRGRYFSKDYALNAFWKRYLNRKAPAARPEAVRRAIR